ncbi:MAG: DUF1700 domain-containing protein [Lachnospiraceae bacterium]|nr:DUF1700 domain-containing protein [Lachnospiraceae bacterium]MBQ6993927.1 DUF1700 domain-containing protein [Lachnospiraceae bacterium]
MSKNEFLNQLSTLLSDVPPEERDEVLAYYREYIEDAGLENEETILEELGTPEAVAAEIKSGMLNKNNQDINYSSNTIKHSPEPYASTQNEQTYSYHYGNTAQQPPVPVQKHNPLLVILAIIGIILLSPVWIGLLGSLLGILLGIFGAVFGLIFGFGIAGLICFIVGIIIFFAAFPVLLHNPLAGLTCIGVGLVVTALGILFMLFTGWLCIGVIPWIIRLLSNLFHRKNKSNKEAHA